MSESIDGNVSEPPGRSVTRLRATAFSDSAYTSDAASAGSSVDEFSIAGPTRPLRLAPDRERRPVARVPEALPVGDRIGPRLVEQRLLEERRRHVALRARERDRRRLAARV